MATLRQPRAHARVGGGLSHTAGRVRAAPLAPPQRATATTRRRAPPAASLNPPPPSSPPPPPPPIHLPPWYAALARANSALPVAVTLAAAAALARPAAFAFFRPPLYAPALGFLSFAIGLSLRPADFAAAAAGEGRALLAGTALQWLVKPALGLGVAALAAASGAPPGVGTGLILVSIVSGAQLAAYATHLAAPAAAPLAVLLTAGSTAAGAVLTPALAAGLLGTRLPVDPAAVLASLAQVVVLPVSAGLVAGAAAPRAVAAARPGLAAAALVDTCLCVAAGLAANAAVIRSAAAAAVLAPVVAFHAAGFAAGWAVGAALPDERKDGGGSAVVASSPSATTPPSRRDRARALSLAGGMQSSLLALLLATRLWPGEPAVALVAGVSTVVMTLMGFALAAGAWRK
jgi:bile acid:Na+ symporter, BASS family